jgi:hypothetical protein
MTSPVLYTYNTIINLIIYLKKFSIEQNMLIHLMPKTNETKNYTIH